MKTSKRGLELIKQHEGCRLEAYKCPANVLTIGYGHTGKDVSAGKKISLQEADELLRKDVKWAERAVNKERLGINQNQFDALVSFVFNLGAGAFLKSTLRKKIVKNPCDPSIENEFSKWVNASGKRLTGLVRRRKEESELYFKDQG